MFGARKKKFSRQSEMTVDSRRGWHLFLISLDESRSVGKASCVKSVLLLRDETEKVFDSYRM